MDGPTRVTVAREYYMGGEYAECLAEVKAFQSSLKEELDKSNNGEDTFATRVALLRIEHNRALAEFARTGRVYASQLCKDCEALITRFQSLRDGLPEDDPRRQICYHAAVSYTLAVIAYQSGNYLPCYETLRQVYVDGLDTVPKESTAVQIAYLLLEVGLNLHKYAVVKSILSDLVAKTLPPPDRLGTPLPLVQSMNEVQLFTDASCRLFLHLFQARYYLAIAEYKKAEEEVLRAERLCAHQNVHPSIVLLKAHIQAWTNNEKESLSTIASVQRHNPSSEAEIRAALPANRQLDTTFEAGQGITYLANSHPALAGKHFAAALGLNSKYATVSRAMVQGEQLPCIAKFSLRDQWAPLLYHRALGLALDGEFQLARQALTAVLRGPYQSDPHAWLRLGETLIAIDSQSLVAKRRASQVSDTVLYTRGRGSARVLVPPGPVKPEFTPSCSEGGDGASHLADAHTALLTALTLCKEQELDCTTLDVSISLNLSYVCLCIGDWKTAHDLAHHVITTQTDGSAKITADQRFLANSYLAESALALGKVEVAVIHLKAAVEDGAGAMASIDAPAWTLPLVGTDHVDRVSVSQDDLARAVFATNMAAVSIVDKDTDSASGYLTQALSSVPNFGPALLCTAYLEVLRGNIAQAVGVLKRRRAPRAKKPKD